MGQASNTPEDEWNEPGWHRVTEPRVHVYSDKTNHSVSHGITRDSDGFTLTYEGGNIFEEFEIFLGRMGSETFEFIVERRLKPVVSSTYVVEISISEAPREVIYKYAKSIAAGLLAMPVTYTGKITEVKFDIHKPGYKRELVNAEDIQT